MFLTTGLLESSMRLKPHEAQNYRKKALWVSWISIVVTLILAVAAFSKLFKNTQFKAHMVTLGDSARCLYSAMSKLK